MMGAVALMPAPAVGSCQHTLSLDGSESFQKELNVTDAAKGLPLTTVTGELSIEGDNSLVPAFESECGSHVAASLADNRVQVEIAGSLSDLGVDESESDPQNGIHGYANFAADLTGPASPLAATFEASFLSDFDDDTGDDHRYFAGRSLIGFFDQRVEALADVALSLDSGESGTGFATKYAISADLWQSDNFSLSSFAGFTFADANYDDDDLDATADRFVREIGASMNWGRMNLNLLNSLATDNVDGDDGQVSNQWTTWDAEVGLDLSDLHPVIPNNLSVGFEIERFAERDGSALAADAARGLSRAIDLDLSWDHHGGTTTFGLSQSMAWERSTATDQTDESKLEIGLGRSIEADGWSLSAEGIFSQELVSEYQDTHRQRSLSFDLGLDMNPSPHESLGFEAGLAFDKGSEGSSMSFGEASAVLTYDLQF
jgi:hypothetical protein